MKIFEKKKSLKKYRKLQVCLSMCECLKLLEFDESFQTMQLSLANHATKSASTYPHFIIFATQ